MTSCVAGCQQGNGNPLFAAVSMVSPLTAGQRPGCWHSAGPSGTSVRFWPNARMRVTGLAVRMPGRWWLAGPALPAGAGDACGTWRCPR